MDEICTLVHSDYRIRSMFEMRSSNDGIFCKTRLSNKTLKQIKRDTVLRHHTSTSEKYSKTVTWAEDLVEMHQPSMGNGKTPQRKGRVKSILKHRQQCVIFVYEKWCIWITFMKKVMENSVEYILSNRKGIVYDNIIFNDTGNNHEGF